MDTLGSMRTKLLTYLKDDEDVDLCNDAINNAIESLWLSCILVHLGQFLGGPINGSTVQFAAGTERVTLVSVPDPVQLIAGNVTQIANTFGFPNLPTRTELFAITYVTESGSETLPDYRGSNGNGTVLAVVVTVGNLAVVTPPTFPNIPSGVPVGWNLYASGRNAAGAPDPTALYKQNPVPMRFDQVWTEPGTGLTNDGNPDLLPPQSNTTADNIFYMRVVEVQNSDQTWTRWTAAELDGLTMDRMVKWIAPQTTYERYAYDFVNGNTLEIRPALGQSLPPRYFFVVKPRRLIYDAATIPFTNLTYNEFIKTYAAAEIRRSNHEYTAASQDGNTAERVRIETMKGLNTQATRKQKSITPMFRY